MQRRPPIIGEGYNLLTEFLISGLTGATVITNLLSPFPSLIEWVSGGHYVGIIFFIMEIFSINRSPQRITVFMFGGVILWIAYLFMRHQILIIMEDW